jgi:hypothetical protein
MEPQKGLYRLANSSLEALGKLDGARCQSLGYFTGGCRGAKPFGREIRAAASGVYHLGALDWLPNVQGLQWYLEQVHPLVHVPVTVISRYWPSHLHTPSGLTHLPRLEDGFSFDAHGIFIAPILSGSGMRIKLLEAMVRGKAIVTTSIGAEGLQNAPGIAVANDPVAFAEAIQRLVDNKDFRMSQGAAAQAHARATFADDAFVASLRAL